MLLPLAALRWVLLGLEVARHVRANKVLYSVDIMGADIQARCNPVIRSLEMKLSTSCRIATSNSIGLEAPSTNPSTQAAWGQC